jgi:uncharacterized protein YutE (UPF0331/DUF86 family)
MPDLIGSDFIQHLAQQGVIPPDKARDVRRVVIDAQRNAVVRLYIEMDGSDRLLGVSVRDDLGVDIMVLEPSEE